MLGGALEMPYLVLLARYAMCRLLIVFSDSIRYFSELNAQNFSRQSCCDDSGPEFDEDGLKAKQQALAKWVPTN